MYLGLMCVHLVVQGPSQVFKTSVIEEVFGIVFQPHAQLLDTSHPDLRQQVPVTVHKHPAEHAVHHGEHLLSVLPQLQNKGEQSSRSDSCLTSFIYSL